MLVKLVMAGFWLALGGMILAWPLFVPDAAPIYIPNTKVSLGWAGIVLGLFNLLRWGRDRSFMAARRQRVEADRARQQRERERKRERRQRPEHEPDPTFDFSQPSPEDRPDEKGASSG